MLGTMRTAVKIALALFVCWLGYCAFLYAEMRRPPEQFAAMIAKLPMPLFFVTPFETLWNRARAGRASPGDMAPDFHLATLDRKSQVSLSSLRGSRPVVLIFGSYT
jgi:hypothetical protein